MTTVANKSLSEVVTAVLDQTNLLTPHEVAKEVQKRLDLSEQLQAFTAILPSYVSSRMSEIATRANNHGRQTGTAWHKQAWNQRRVASSAAPNGWVMWPDFSLDMALANLAEIERREKATARNKAWISDVIDALKANSVKRIKDLPVAVRRKLEEAHGS